MLGAHKHLAAAAAAASPQPLPTSIFYIISLLLLLTSAAAAADQAFTPSDNYLLSCGSPDIVPLDDGRVFRSDHQSASLLSTPENIKVTTNTNSTTIPPLYRSARVFNEESSFSFFISNTGLHIIRLHFYPLPDPTYNLSSSVFSVTTDNTVLLRHFSPPATTPTLKDYLVPVSGNRLSLTFSPEKNSIAFINSIELFSAPNNFIPDTAAIISRAGGAAAASGVSEHALEVTHRLNAGGPALDPANDTLARAWGSDAGFLNPPEMAKTRSVDPREIKYPGDRSVTPSIAPALIYATADEMADSGVPNPNFNITWVIPADTSYSHFVRAHFCDIVSKNDDHELFFDVYINGHAAVSNLDLMAITNGTKIPHYIDFVVEPSSTVGAINDTIVFQVGPGSGSTAGSPNAILNGLEVMKMSNPAGSLDGPYDVNGSFHGGSSGTSRSVWGRVVSGISLAAALAALVLVVLMFCRWRRRPADWRKSNSFSSWFLPIHLAQSSKRSAKSRFFSTNRSKNAVHSSFFASSALVGRHFTFAELQEATGNFDEKAVVGVGGFGKVYLGEMAAGTKLAVKRGNPSSEQGINEFQTEIQMLSKLRHRHLVSLIGCCDENSEMILVYEYMSKGPLRDHLYGGSGLPPLSWKQRLEVCIGAARGLHYLHTGAAQGIIHRDVKTTNILLDENFVAKVSDFGLSKDGPASVEQTHVSTAVKGSFGYLDPEYFRLQQLTEKSDVYSFGVVMFEVLCARAVIKPGLPREQVNLAEFAMQLHRRGELGKIVDPRLAGTIGEASLWKFVEAAEKCLADQGADRPSMGDVLWNLEYALQLQETTSAATEEKHGDCESGTVMEKSGDDTISEDSGAILAANPLFQGR